MTNVRLNDNSTVISSSVPGRLATRIIYLPDWAMMALKQRGLGYGVFENREMLLNVFSVEEWGYILNQTLLFKLLLWGLDISWKGEPYLDIPTIVSKELKYISDLKNDYQIPYTFKETDLYRIIETTPKNQLDIGEVLRRALGDAKDSRLSLFQKADKPLGESTTLDYRGKPIDRMGVHFGRINQGTLIYVDWGSEVFNTLSYRTRLRLIEAILNGVADYWGTSQTVGSDLFLQLVATYQG